MAGLFGAGPAGLKDGGVFDPLRHLTIGENQNIEDGEMVAFALEFVDRYTPHLKLVTDPARLVHRNIAANMDPWVEDKPVRKDPITALQHPTRMEIALRAPVQRQIVAVCAAIRLVFYLTDGFGEYR